jgi:hypothetical protein
MTGGVRLYPRGFDVRLVIRERIGGLDEKSIATAALDRRSPQNTRKQEAGCPAAGPAAPAGKRSAS